MQAKDTDNQPSNIEVAKRVPGTIEEIVSRLEKAYTRNWHNGPDLALINQIFPGKKREVRENRARALALYKEVILLIHDPNKKFKLSDIHRGLLLGGFDIQKPKLTTYTKFEQFINRGPGKNLEEFIEYLKDKPRGNGNRKIGHGLILKIRKIYSLNAKNNFNDICEKLNSGIRQHVKENGVCSAIEEFELPNTDRIKKLLEAGMDYLSVSSIKKNMPREHRNGSFRGRNGNSAFRNSTKPLHRKKAINPLDRVEVDSTQFKFVFRDENKKISTIMTTCIVVDCCSGKILGYAIGKHESGALFLEALKNSFSNLGLLPAELFTDRFPGYNSKEMNILKQMESLGCIVTIEKTGNPRAKGTVEATINNLCELAKDYPNFIGKNITTKSINSRKSVEAISSMARVANLKQKDFVKEQLMELFARYNGRKAKDSNVSRDEIFNAKAKVNAIPVTLEQRVWLFHKVAVMKVGNGGVIRFTRRIEEYYYDIKDHTTRLRYTGGHVRVRFTEEDLTRGNEIFLFDVETDEIICSCNPMRIPHQAKINQTADDEEIIKDFVSDKKAFTAHIGKIEEELNEVEIKNFLNASKAEQIKNSNLLEMQSMMPDHRFERVAVDLGNGRVEVLTVNSNRGKAADRIQSESNDTDDSIVEGESIMIPNYDRLDLGMA